MTRKTRPHRRQWGDAVDAMPTLKEMPSLREMPAIVRPALQPPAVKAAGYPLRGSWWTHPGEIHAHLLSGEHAGKFDRDWIRSLTVSEAESLHSDDHEGRVKWQFVVKPKPAIQYQRP